MASLKDVHESDINTVDWSALNTNLIATGSNDTLVKIIDTRKAYKESKHSVCKVLRQHKAKVQTVKFSPFDSRYLASSGDCIIFWDLGEGFGQEQMQEEELKQPDTTFEEDNSEDHIILNHIGHVGTVSDFDWNHILPWTMLSASDDSETFVQIQRNNDCSMQIFRPLSLLI